MLNQIASQLDFHAKALALRAQRQQLIASNIANADTPGYKAKELEFSSALRAAAAQASKHEPALGPGGASLISSAPVPNPPIASIATGGILGSGSQGDVHGGQLREVHPNQDSLDQNTVDMDRERAAFMHNALHYESTLRFINSHVRTATEAMKSHTQG